ncbi:hypothetical protein [Streptomyces sp. NBC_01244]|nr:hypothetical protein OG247_44165 [Streptomyces sp. NBC_01244]
MKLRIHDSFDGGDLWSDLRDFFDGDPDRIEQVIVGLDFSLLD